MISQQKVKLDEYVKKYSKNHLASQISNGAFPLSCTYYCYHCWKSFQTWAGVRLWGGWYHTILDRFEQTTLFSLSLACVDWVFAPWYGLARVGRSLEVCFARVLDVFIYKFTVYKSSPIFAIVSWRCCFSSIWPILACSCWQTSMLDINESGHQTKWSCHLLAETGTNHRIINRSEQPIQQRDARSVWKDFPPTTPMTTRVKKKTRAYSTNPGGRVKL